MKKVIVLLAMLIIAFSLLGCFSQLSVKADMENIKIDVDGFDKGLSEIVVTDDLSICVSADIVWKDIQGGYTITWALVGDNLDCEISVIDPSCTNGRLATIDFGNKTGKVILRATAKSKNEISADLIVWIGQPKIGGFYELEEAYENEWLTESNLENIAYYYNNCYNKAEMFAEKLNEEVEVNIKQAYLKQFYPELLIDFSGYGYIDIENPIDGVNITEYYGTYNDCVIVSVWDDFVCYEWPQTFDVSIGGAVFNDFWIREIFVWVDEQQINVV